MTAAIKLVDQIRNVLRVKHYTLRTEKSYLAWIIQYVAFHHMRPPGEMGVSEIEAFLSHLAGDKHVGERWDLVSCIN